MPALQDTLFILGIALTAVGVWQIYAPAAYIVVGVVLVGLGILSAWRKAS
jgi:hypothetical protein